QKSWSQKYCALYDSSKFGVKRLEIYDSEENFSRHAQHKIITLEQCVKVVPALQKHQPNVFEVQTQTQDQQFSAESFGEMTEWIEAVQTVSFGQLHSVDVAGKSPDPVVEENTLYNSVDVPHVYTVSAVETEAAVRCRLEGHFYLLVGPRGLSLASRGHQGAVGKVLFWWPFCNIRRYGIVEGAFSFEAGRKCASGEGLFLWKTPEAADIHRAMAGWLKVSADSAVAHSQEVEQHCYENWRPESLVEHVQCNDAEYAVIRKSSALP
ncbi:unnamed protein product, partial [Ixodes hexagonus]